MKHVLIVGKKFSGLAHAVEAAGHTYTLLQDSLATKFPERKVTGRVVADFSSNQALFEAVDHIHSEHPIDGVITMYENYVLQTAIIGEHLGLPHLPVHSAEACTDKYLMRSLFAKAPEKVSPDFAIVNGENELRSFASSHSFPLILKPANLAKSLLVTRNDTLDQLLDSYHRSVELLETTYKKYAPHRSPKLIIEEYLEGSIHSVDAFIDSSGEPRILDEIVDYQTGYDIGYEDNFHYSRVLPSKLSHEDQQSLHKVAEVGVRALGMRSSAAHIEIIMTKEGPRIVEIGARNGGYRERMHRLANGLDILGNALHLALDEPLTLQSSRHDSVAVLELFPKSPGNFVGLHEETALKELPSLNYLSIKPEIGQFIGKSSDGHKMSAIIILHNSNGEQFARDLEFVNQSVWVETKSNDV
jgi:hypothetical protein